MSVSTNIGVFRGLKVHSKKSNHDFHQKSYEYLLKEQLTRNEKLEHFQNDAANQNQSAINFYNARKERLSLTLKQFEEDERRAAQIAVYEKFLQAIMKVRSSLLSESYKTIISKFFGTLDAASFNGTLYGQFIHALTVCSEINLDDLQKISPVLEKSVSVDLQRLQVEATSFIGGLRDLLTVSLDGLSVEQLSELHGRIGIALQSEVALRLVHPVVVSGRKLQQELSVRIGQEVKAKEVASAAAAVAIAAAPAPKPTVSSTAIASNEPISLERSHLSYVEEARTSAVWIVKIEKTAGEVVLPPEVSAVLGELLQALRTEVKPADESPSIDPTDIIKRLQSLLREVVALGSGSFVGCFLSIMKVIVEEVRVVESELVILTYSAILTGVFDSLPAGMQKESSRIIRALLVAKSSACVPSFLPAVAASGGVKALSEKNVRLLTLFAALVGRSGHIASPFSAEDGWTWLARSAKQLCFLKSESAKVSVANTCRCIRVMLKFSGNVLFLQFQDKMKSLVAVIGSALSGLADEDSVKLKSFVDKNGQFVSPLYCDGVTPYAQVAQELASQLTSTKAEVAAIDADKASSTFETIRLHQIDRLRVIFNKLSATPESQGVAVSSLLEKILVASKVSPELLRYTLFKVSNNIISDSQEEVFNETDEGHPTKLARVTCGLCAEIKDLAPVMRAQFFDHCPLTIPRSARDGLSGDDFLVDLRFRKKKAGAWEDKQQWLARMSKMLSTFAVIVIQPEQMPFGLVDGWNWMANLANTACSAATPTFYVAAALEVFLRIASPRFLAVYGDRFLLLLRLMRDTLLPKMNADMPRRQCLLEFLQRFLDSRGADFMTLFQKPL